MLSANVLCMKKRKKRSYCVSNVSDYRGKYREKRKRFKEQRKAAEVSPSDKVSTASSGEPSGYNSEDEYEIKLNLKSNEWKARDALFLEQMVTLGFEVKEMCEDGACLFRAIADQIFGDQEVHHMVRNACLDYIVKNKDFFVSYVTEDFDKYVARKRKWNVHGNHLEIQAMSEMYNRCIEVYCYEIEPIHIFNAPQINADEPIRLSYHRMCHYNSIINPKKPSIGVGLGLPAYIEPKLLKEAVRATEESLIEQTMLEDKLQATDWEATNEALFEEIARESYIQYYRDVEKRLKSQGAAGGGASSSTPRLSEAPKSECSGYTSLRASPRSPREIGTTSPVNNCSGYTSLRASPR